MSSITDAPTITSILTVPGHSTTGQDSERGLSQGNEAIQVGIVLDGSRIAWGTCDIISGEDLPDHPKVFRANDGIVSIENAVNPVLIGQKLTSFRQLATLIESQRETATFIQEISHTDEPSPGISRRDIITGFLSTSEPASPKTILEERSIERRLHPAIRQGLSQALLAAVAMDRRLTMAEIIAEEFELPIPSTAVPLQISVKRGQSLLLHDQVSTLAFDVGESDPIDSLGGDSERIQRFIRQLRERLVRDDQECQIAIHLDARGSFGKLYANDIGKVLGALYGLEQAASPCLIRVQDPLILEERDDQMKTLGQLRDYLRMRGMSLQIVAGEKIRSLDDVKSFIQAEAAHMLLLIMPRLGTVQEVVLAMQACRANDIGILLQDNPSIITSQMAFVTQPDVLAFPPTWPSDSGVAMIHNEMARLKSWFDHKNL